MSFSANISKIYLFKVKGGFSLFRSHYCDHPLQPTAAAPIHLSWTRKVETLDAAKEVTRETARARREDLIRPERVLASRGARTAQLRARFATNTT